METPRLKVKAHCSFCDGQCLTGICRSKEKKAKKPKKCFSCKSLIFIDSPDTIRIAGRYWCKSCATKESKYLGPSPDITFARKLLRDRSTPMPDLRWMMILTDIRFAQRIFQCKQLSTEILEAILAENS